MKVVAIEHVFVNKEEFRDVHKMVCLLENVISSCHDMDTVVKCRKLQNELDELFEYKEEI